MKKKPTTITNHRCASIEKHKECHLHKQTKKSKLRAKKKINK